MPKLRPNIKGSRHQEQNPKVAAMPIMQNKVEVCGATDLWVDQEAANDLAEVGRFFDYVHHQDTPDYVKDAPLGALLHIWFVATNGAKNG